MAPRKGPSQGRARGRGRNRGAARGTVPPLGMRGMSSRDPLLGTPPQATASAAPAADAPSPMEGVLTQFPDCEPVSQQAVLPCVPGTY